MRALGFMPRWVRGLALVQLAGALILEPATTSAHETDNFSLPLDTELADLGHFLETVHTLALQEAVTEVNAAIENALRSQDPARAARLERWHDPLALADAFLARFGHPMFEDGQAERALRGAWARRVYPGQAPSHQDIWMNFSAHFLLNPRSWTVPTQSRTVKAYGVYFGTDKLVHFHHLGADYYRMHRSLVRSGLSPEAAYRKVLEHFAETGVWSERALFGKITTGVYSNADLAVNHLGFKFFVNLTQKVRLKGVEQEPLVVRSGVFWRLNQQVRPRSGWFRAYLSDHWNEALNPNRYHGSIRSGIRRVLQNRAQTIVQFYTQKDGRPADPAYFGNLAEELSTYYGEPYGHCGQVDKLMTIGNTCIPAAAAMGAD